MTKKHPERTGVSMSVVLRERIKSCKGIVAKNKLVRSPSALARFVTIEDVIDKALDALEEKYGK